MNLKALVGSGDRVMGLWLPFAVIGIGANIVWPAVFRMRFGGAGLAAGFAVLAVGLPLWITSIVQVLTIVPKGRLITTGPFALMLHPLYTSVALLVIPGVGLVLDTWVGFALGAVLYLSSRLSSPREEDELSERFGAEYEAYRKRVILPWL